MTTIDDDDGLAMETGVKILAAMDAEFHDAPDRVLAIVGAAYLDALLEQLLRAIFVDDKETVGNLLGVRGALGANGTRFQLAYCLGLIDKQERDDLKTIADIRNAFAHQFDLRSFDHPRAEGHLAKLHVGKQLDTIVADLIARASSESQRQSLREVGASGRRKFQDTVRSLFGSLLRKLDTVVRPSPQAWYRSRESNAECATD